MRKLRILLYFIMTRFLMGQGSAPVDSDSDGRLEITNKQHFEITVISQEDPLVIENPIDDIEVDEDSPNYSIDLVTVFSDPDNDPIHYGLESSIDSLDFNGNGMLLWHFTPQSSGRYELTVFVTDNTIARVGHQDVVGIDRFQQGKPTQFALQQNDPNPFNPVTTIQYKLPKAAEANITIYDIAGKPVEQLVNSHKPAGYYQVDWRAGSNPSGVYLYKFETKTFTTVKRCILMKCIII